MSQLTAEEAFEMRYEWLEPRQMLIASPMISEFMASNDGAFVDGDGVTSDWIELYNAGDELIDLAHWHLTDDADELSKWTFPEDRPELTELGPGEFMIVFASGTHLDELQQPIEHYIDAAGYLHADFALSTSGEYLALVQPGDSVTGPRATDVQSQHGSPQLDYPAQLSDVSYGFLGDTQSFQLIDQGSTALWLVPTDESIVTEMADRWTGADETFDDSPSTTTWQEGNVGVGFEATPATALLAYWDFDNQAEDLIGGRTGDIQGAVFTDETPAALNSDAALQFDGVDDYVELSPYLDDFANLESGTMSAWFKTPTAKAQVILASSDTNDRRSDLNLTVKFGAVIYDVRGDVPSDGELTSARTDSRTVSNDRWRHVAVTVDAEQETTRLYLDGQLVDDDELRDYEEPFFAGIFDLSHLAIGRDVHSRGGELYFEGAIDDVAIWSEPLTPEQIDQLTQGISPRELTGVAEQLASDVEATLHHHASSLYLRTPFELTRNNDAGETVPIELAGNERLELAIQYDDGFVAYLNGIEVARRFAPDVVAYDSVATSSSDAAAFREETIDLSHYLSLLQPGQTNYLAIQGLNVSSSDTDFLLAPKLSLHQHHLDTTRSRFFVEPTPASFNGTGVIGVLQSEPDASVARGLYTKQDLTGEGPLANGVSLTEASGGAQILYTTDGRMPIVQRDGTIDYGTVYDPNVPLAINTTTTLRMLAFRPDYEPTSVVTYSYLILDDVVQMTNEQLDPVDYPADWGTHIEGDLAAELVVADYAMDPEVVNDPGYSETLFDDLRSIPTMSIVMDPADLFSEERGIYANPYARGSQTERGASIELILADGTTAFQEDAGLRIHGGASRRPRTTPKHSFRLEFKPEFGDTRLRYPLFGEEGASDLDSIVLRGGYNDSWPQGSTSATYSRDQMIRQTHAAMGQVASHGTYVHLYLNGIYWGLYNPAERPSSDFQATYFGGDQDDYDVVNHNGLQSGSLEGWEAAQQLAKQGLESPETYAQFQQLVDVESLADYMLVNIFAGTQDWPGNNWYAARQREPAGPYRFFVWDAEQTLGGTNVNQTGVENVNSPAYLYAQARKNADFRSLFADRVQLHMYNDGALTPENMAARFDAIHQQIDRAIVGESARWGDAAREPAQTRDDQWLTSVQRVDLAFLQERFDRVVEQLKEVELISPIPVPSFNPAGGDLTPGLAVELTSFESPRVNDTVVIDSGHRTQISIPADASLDATWFGQTFEPDANWFEGTTGVGYDSPNAIGLLPGIETDITDAWNAHKSSVYMRLTFDVDLNSIAADEWLLQMQFDDGFVAYLNGVEVARSTDVPEGLPSFNTYTGTSRPDEESLVFTTFDVSPFAHLLLDRTAGTNVLAIHGLNRSEGDRDLLMTPRLVARQNLGIFPAPIYYTTDGSDPRSVAAQGNLPNSSAQLYETPIILNSAATVQARVYLDGQWSALHTASFTVANGTTAAEALRISEIHFNPAAPTPAELSAGFNDSDDFEFIELLNTSQYDVDLTDVRLRREDNVGVEFAFGQDELLSIGPGERIVVVEDVEAFRYRYGDEIIVAGQWAGGLANGGERIRLDAGETTIHQFEYVDDWYDAADGGGSSLELIEPLPTDLAQWARGESWQPSITPGGTPGDARQTQLPGDANRDGLFNSDDLVAIFQAAEYDDGVLHNSTWSEGDWNRDGEFDSRDLVLAFQLNRFNATLPAGAVRIENVAANDSRTPPTDRLTSAAQTTSNSSAATAAPRPSLELCIAAIDAFHQKLSRR